MKAGVEKEPFHVVGRTLPERLAWLRCLRDLSLRDVTLATGIQGSTYWRWELGKTRMPATAVGPLARLFGVRPCELLDLNCE